MSNQTTLKVEIEKRSHDYAGKFNFPQENRTLHYTFSIGEKGRYKTTFADETGRDFQFTTQDARNFFTILASQERKELERKREEIKERFEKGKLCMTPEQLEDAIGTREPALPTSYKETVMLLKDDRYLQAQEFLSLPRSA